MAAQAFSFSLPPTLEVSAAMAANDTDASGALDFMVSVRVRVWATRRYRGSGGLTTTTEESGHPYSLQRISLYLPP